MAVCESLTVVVKKLAVASKAVQGHKKPVERRGKGGKGRGQTDASKQPDERTADLAKATSAALKASVDAMLVRLVK